MAKTLATDLINPEVMAVAIAGNLDKQIRFAPYARVDDTLVGQAGDTITRPRYAYIGPADDLSEGVPMDTTKLSMTTATVTIKEAGKAVEVTEKAVLTNTSGTLGEAENQIGLSIADKLDIDYLASMATTALKFTGTATTSANILDAIALFNDEDEQDYVLFINPTDYTSLYKSMVVGNTFLSISQLAELLGLKDIVKTKRVAVGTSYIQKVGAVEIVYKKTPEIKKDEDILARTFVIAGNTFYTTNLYNEGGVVKLSAV